MAPIDDHFRPQYHYSPPANWMNDPNGLVFYRGKYHLFYQYHPGSSDWGPMHWGHAVSADLVNWQHLPVALSPDEHGAIFSGCALIDWQNTAGFGKEAMVAIFTHYSNTHTQAQSLAYSTDEGLTWTKYPGNPVLLPPDGLVDFRDPKVFWYEENGSGCWVMALAAKDAIFFYSSPDLIHWTQTGSFGGEHGCHPGVWETPDLFQLPVDGSAETRWVLTTGIGAGGPGGLSGMQYFIGHFDGRNFHSENPKDAVLWMDYGADFYAGQSWSDEPCGRRVMIGWLSNWQYARTVPTITWRGSSNLPRELSLKPTGSGIRLFQRPVSEVSSLRDARFHWENLDIAPGANLLEDVQGDAFELMAEFQVAERVTRFGLRVRVGEGEHTTIGYDVSRQRFFVDRSLSGQSDFDPGFARVHSAELAPADGVIRLQLFLDRSCLEVFVNDGRLVIADLIFPDEKSLGVELFSQGGSTTLNWLDLYTLAPARFIVNGG